MAVADYDPVIEAASKEWDVDPNWVRSVMQQETGGNPLRNGKPIVGSSGERGLMQIMPKTAAGLGLQNPDDPVENIWGGVKYLAQLRDQFHGNVPHATAAYNAGPERMNDYLNNGRPLPDSTAKIYLPAVSGHYQNFAKQPRPTNGQPASPSDIPSNDDFLKMLSGGDIATPQSAGVPSNDDFLKMLGGKPAAPAAPASPSPTQLAEGEGANPYDAGAPLPPGAGVGLKSIGTAMAEGATRGWQNTPDILTPQASAWLASHGMATIGNNTGLPSYALKAVGAAGNALQAGIAQAGTVAGVPQLGRDLAAFPEAFAPDLSEMVARPMVRAAPLAADAAEGGIVRNPLVAAPATNLLTGLDDIPAYARRGVDPATGAVTAPIEAPVNPLASSHTAPAPQPLGAAATPTELTNMAPAEALASRSTGEIQRVLDPAKPGIDTTIYVPGTQPTEAEVSGSPTVAAEQKFNRSRNPDPHIAVEQANNAARVEYFDQTAGTPTQVQRLKDARDEQATSDLRAAFGNKGIADAQPVVDTIHGILSDPRLGERDAVKGFISPYLDKLENSDGTLKTDPEALYGIRENITDQLARNGDPKNAGARQVRRQLMQVKGALDDAIEQAAPGYRQYLDNYSTASRPIEAMEYLQDMRPSLTNAQGNMTPAAFDRFMKNTVADRAAGGISPAASLTDEQMSVLHNIHSDLKRFQNINLSNPRGSDTNMLGHLASKGGELAAHGVANYFSPVLGSVAVQMGKNALEKRGIERVTRRVLNPNPLKYPPDTGP